MFKMIILLFVIWFFLKKRDKIYMIVKRVVNIWKNFMIVI